MTATYDCIATTTATSTVTEVIFSSISGSFTDLILICSIQPSNTDSPGVGMRVNSDSGSNYSGTFIYNDGGSGGASNRITNNTNFVINRNSGLGDSTTGSPNIIVNLLNYSNTTTYKTIINRANSPAGSTFKGLEASVGLWRSTSAITSIRVFVNAGGFASGSMFSLYGVKAE